MPIVSENISSFGAPNHSDVAGDRRHTWRRRDKTGGEEAGEERKEQL